MNCREVIEFLMDYSAGELPPETLEVFLEHVGNCPPCLAYLESYEQTVKLCRGACYHTAEEVPEELILAILSARPGPDPTESPSP